MKFKPFAKLIATTIFAMSFLTGCGSNQPAEHDHIWGPGEITKEPTCHSEGIRTFKCTVEGCEQTKTENVAMTAHDWDEGEITIAPTCAETGTKTFTCKNEGCDKIKTVTLDKTDHNYIDNGISVTPDLLNKGEKELQCSMCGDIKKEEVPAHADFVEQYDNEKYKWMYCSLDGYTPASEDLFPTALVKDGDVYKNESVEISKGYVKTSGTALIVYGFDYDEERISVGASVTFNGKDDNTRVEAYLVVVNSVGHVKYSFRVSEDAKSWNYELPTEGLFALDRYDSVCLVINSGNDDISEGSVSFTITAECIHIWNEGVVTKEPTEEEEGIREFTCIVCGEKLEHAIPKLDPVIPPADEYFDFTDKNINRFEGGIVGNSWVTDDGHAFHVEVTTAGTNIWEGGAFVNTGIPMEEGKAYKATFNVSSLEENDYEIIFQNRQWDEKQYEKIFTPKGETEIVYVVTEENVGTLWIYVQFGNVTNEVVINNMKIEETELPHVHIWDDGVITREPTCTVDGELTYTCTVPECGETKIESIPALTHAWDNGVITREPTCAVEGELTYTCTNPGCDETKVEPIPVVAHSWNEGEVIVEPTVDHVGTRRYTCTVCDETYDEEIEKLDPPADEYVVLTDRVEGYFDKPAGNIWVDEFDNTKAHLEISTPVSGAWKGGMFINTGVTLTEGKNYRISFNAEHIGTGSYNFIFKNGQWSDVVLGNIENPLGIIYKDINVDTDQSGTLWIYIEAAEDAQEIIVSSICVKEFDSYFIFDSTVPNYENRFDRVVGSAAVDSTDNKAAILTITQPVGDMWKGGMFINTGVELVNGNTYDIEFNVTREQENGYNILFLNKQWDGIELGRLATPVGDSNININIDSTVKEGTLWIYVEAGNAVNVVRISSIVVNSDPAIELTGRIYERFDGPIANSWIDAEDSSKIHLEVSEPCGDIWRAGLFINLGDSLVAGNKYRISLEASQIGTGPYNIIIRNGKWDGGEIDRFVDPSGAIYKEIVVPNDKEGPLWLYIEAGTSIHEIIIGKILVEQVDNVVMTDHIEGRFDGPVGTVTIDTDDDTVAYLDITEACGDISRGGMYIEGINIEEGKTYLVSFEIETENASDYKVVFTNGKGGTVIDTLVNPTSISSYELEIPADENGKLWIDIESGNAINKISISKLMFAEKVEE